MCCTVRISCTALFLHNGIFWNPNGCQLLEKGKLKTEKQILSHPTGRLVHKDHELRQPSCDGLEQPLCNSITHRHRKELKLIRKEVACSIIWSFSRMLIDGTKK